VRLRLYHHSDGARVAYREAGTGPGLALLHAVGLTHREWEPVVEHLAHRFRLVLPDLPGHGDSEDRPRHPYTPEWLVDLLAGFCADTLGPRPLVGAHGAAAELLVRAVAARRIAPDRLVLMPSRLHAPPARGPSARAARLALRAAGLPGLDRAVSHGAALVVRPSVGAKLSARGEPAAADLIRHAVMDLGGNANRARTWAKLARAWPRPDPAATRAALGALALPVLLLWADEDPHHPLAIAEEALDLLPDGQLRVLPGTGFLLSYDDPVGVARELAAFCG
jgi:pimeloyl-ACP methyl ester carboxylesterase